MKINGLKCCVLFLVVLVVLVSPACAVQMEDIAHEAGKYNEESKKEMGFFAKAQFMAKGFQLLDKAEKASKETEKQGNKKKEDVDEYDKLGNQHTLTEKQQQIPFQSIKMSE